MAFCVNIWLNISNCLKISILMDNYYNIMHNILYLSVQNKFIYHLLIFIYHSLEIFTKFNFLLNYSHSHWKETWFYYICIMQFMLNARVLKLNNMLWGSYNLKFKYICNYDILWTLCCFNIPWCLILFF